MVHSNTQTRMLTFDLTPEQYTYAYKDYNKNLKPGLKKSSLPLHCIINRLSEVQSWTSRTRVQSGPDSKCLGPGPLHVWTGPK